MNTKAIITLPILLAGVAASAQDISAEPTYGTVGLASGFVPDPHVVELTAGGSVDASSVDGNCAGFIADAPDVDFNFEAGSLPLHFTATSEGDTTLVINQPDGSWICNDDADGTFNPRISLDSPQSGLYNIWVGSYSAGEMPAASLAISELPPAGQVAQGAALAAAASPASAGLDVAAEPGFGTVTLDTGFVPDPHQTELIAGGTNELSSQLAEGCVGFVATAPDVDLHYTGGEVFPLNIYVTSESDTTLAVNLPDGTWACSDDVEGFNPALSFESPQSGLYNIWVGTYDSENLPAAVLNISELDPQW